MPAKTRLAKAGGVAALALLLAAVPTAAFANDTVGTATLTGGALSLVTPDAVAFSATLTGSDQSVPASQDIDVVDGTGSASGWNVTLTSTTFSSGSNELAADAATDQGASGSCDAGVTCTLADNSATSYPVAVPAADVAPTAVRIQSAASGTGMGGQTWTHNMALDVAGNAVAGTYTSTWTYSLVSGP